MTDPAATYEALRASTAEMLKLDPANLSLVEGLQLDLIALLRLTTSDMQGAALSGEAVDLDRLSTALGMLQKLLPAQALVASAQAADNRDEFAGAKEELARLLEQRAEALERRDRRREAELAADPAKARAEFEATLQRAIENHAAVSIDGLKPGGGGAAQRDSSVLPPEPSYVAAVGGEHPVLVEPQLQPAPPPQRIETDVEKMERANSSARPPARYLKQPDEEWRAFIGPDGEINTSPWRR